MAFIKKPVSESIDFLKPALKPLNYLMRPKQRGKKLKKIWLYFFVFLIIAAAGFSTRIVISSNETISNFKGGGILTQLKNLLIKKDDDLAGIKEDRINILVLGIGGSNHPGPLLTDTIILISIKPKDKQVAMISIPRDLYLNTGNIGGAKINALYSLGETEGKNQGGELIKQAIAETFGINIHYYARIDFNGFQELIDAFGGVDIYVDQTFTDSQFPDNNFKTQTISFDAGWQHFDGLTALRYARSRHGGNGEGSDFARAKRQQKIILSLKDKTFEIGLLLRPDKINKIIQILGSSIVTDMEIWELLKLGKLTSDIPNGNVIQKVLDDSPDGELRAATGIDGAFLLIPKNKQKLKLIVQNIFQNT